MRTEWKPSRKSLFRVVAGATAFVLVLAGVVAYRSCIPGMTFDDGRAFAATLEPVASDSLGVAPDSAFTLKLDQSVPLASVRSAFTIEPEVKFSVKAADQAGMTFKVAPDEPLAPDHVYQFRLSLAGPTEPGYSWAFQVAGDLRIVESLPADRSTGVPTNTGIELEFTSDSVNEPGAFFSISPFVPGSWERHRRTLVYVPAVPLEPSTLYTCTVRQGLGAAGSDQALKTDYTFSFETAAQETTQSYWFYVDTSEVQFAPTEAPFFSVSFGSYGGGTISKTVSTKVYRYPDAAAYVAALGERANVPYWAYLTRQNWDPPTAGLEPILDTDLQAQTFQWNEYLVLPGELRPGYYLVRFTYQAGDYYAWIQVTDLSSYTVEATDSTVLWFNSLAAGGPVSGVTVRSGDGGVPLGTSSDADGLVRFNTPAKLQAAEPAAGGAGAPVEPLPPYYVTAKAPDGSEVSLDLSPYWNPYDSRQRAVDEYWTYLYTDRPLYLPDDEVCFWGVLQPRERGASEVSQVEVELQSSWGIWRGPFGGWSDGSGSSDNVISRTQVDVKRHTFEGRLKLPNLRPGSYYLVLRLDGTELVTRYIEVATYTKPAYKVSLSADKRAVFAGQTVNFDLSAAFFEGTPVPELKLDYNLSAGGTSLSGSLATDPAGQARLAHTPKAGGDPLVLERGDWLSVNADLPESGPIWASSSVRVFEKDVALRASATADAAGFGIAAKMNKVTLDRINAPDDGSGTSGSGSSGPAAGIWSGTDDYTGDPVADREISGQVFEVRWDAHETGQYYDFVDKVTRKTYEYVEVKVPVQSFTMTTGADGAASWAFAADQSKSYFVRLDSRDDSGRAIATQFYFYGRAYLSPEWGYHWYHLAPVGRDQARYTAGETVQLAVKDAEASVPARANGFLFYTARRGLGDVAVTDEPSFSFTFTEELIPNTNVGAVYFDGRYYNDCYSLPVAFDYTGRELAVSVKTDKASYAPGDTATIEVAVKDAEGQPVGAEVNLCAVDEALYYLSDQWVDLAASLYDRAVPSYVIYYRGTHYRRIAGGGGAESGGEGGGVRDNFLDNALFASVTTGADGTGTVQMQVPDNLTSWRLTYQAFASGVRAGSGSVGIPVRLPFFVDLSLNQTYLAGDQPVVGVRAYGSALPSGTPVMFTAKLARMEGGQAAEEYDLAAVDGKAFTFAGIDLGKLAEGTFRLTVAGKATLPDGQAVEDAMAKTIEVLATYLRVDTVDYYQVAEGLQVAAEPGELATLTFSDQARGRYLQMLWRLAAGGSRSDMKAAAIVAHRLLVQDFGYSEEALWPAPAESDLVACQREDGGVGILTYASSDLELTAKLAALGGVGFDEEGLLGYLGRVYDNESDNRERLIEALYGLAALGQPVLSDLQAVAAAPDLTAKEKLYASLGLIECGDEEIARRLFGEVLEEFGDRVGPMLRLNVSRDQEEIITATSLGAVIAGELRMQDKDNLLGYLTDNVPWEELNLVEMALFLQAVVPATPSEAVSFTLEPDGTSISLKPGETYTCLRTADQLGALGFSKVKGNVGLCVSYRAPADLSGVAERGDQVTVQRDYYVRGGDERSTVVFDAGDIVKVVLTYKLTSQAPEGPYQVVDFLPSGLVAIPWPYELGINDPSVDYPVEIDGQKVTFNLSLDQTPGPIDPKTGKPQPRGGTGAAIYYARVVSLGDYQSDPAVVTHVKSGEIFAVSPRSAIEIK